MNAPYELWGFDPDNGDFLEFSPRIQDETICGSPVARDGIAYAVVGRSGSAVAVKAGGRDDASQLHVLWKKSLSSYVPLPVLAGDRILSISERGVVGCLSAKSGEQSFQTRLRSKGGTHPAQLGSLEFESMPCTDEFSNSTLPSARSHRNTTACGWQGELRMKDRQDWSMMID
ncbi:MAG: PQQ-binding-like beta-propeller repeat protein [Planctomycetaceae bacterium]